MQIIDSHLRYYDTGVRNVVIFGLDEIASQAWYLFTNDTPYHVVAFTADLAYCTTKRKHNLPVVPFEKILDLYSPKDTGIHVAVGWKYMNKFRQLKVEEVRLLGYPLLSYVSRYAFTWPDLKLGENCEIHQNVSIGPFVEIGSNCLVFNSAQISHESKIENDCYIAAGVSILAGAQIGERCLLGAGSRVLDGISLAAGCFIAAGSLVTTDTDEDGFYKGIPARRGTVAASQHKKVL